MRQTPVYVSVIGFQVDELPEEKTGIFGGTALEMKSGILSEMENEDYC
jgi:hypothetical protein